MVYLVFVCVMGSVFHDFVMTQAGQILVCFEKIYTQLEDGGSTCVGVRWLLAHTDQRPAEVSYPASYAYADAAAAAPADDHHPLAHPCTICCHSIHL